MNLGFRLYDPTIGRFLSVDPLFEMQPGYTPYHYCFNDPVNGSDPSGLVGRSRTVQVWGESPQNEGQTFTIDIGLPTTFVPIKPLSADESGTYYDEFAAINWVDFDYRPSSITMNGGRWGKSYGYGGGACSGGGGGSGGSGGSSAGNSGPKNKPGVQIPNKTSKDLPEGVIENSSHTFNDYDIKYLVNLSDSYVKNIITEAYSKWKKNDNLTRLQFIREESPEKHALDFKHQFMKEAVYIYDGYAYNRDEMGNYLWGAVVGNFGIPLPIAQFGAERYAQSKTGKPDQYWEVWAYSRAIQKFFIPPIPEWPYPSHLTR